MSDKFPDIYAEVSEKLVPVKDKIALYKKTDCINIDLRTEDAAWMVKVIETLKFHCESLMSQENFDAFRKAELIRLNEIQEKKLLIYKNGLQYISSIPHNWEESYGNASTSCARKAIETLEKAEELKYYESKRTTV